MIPHHFYDQDRPERAMNGPRPSRLQINKHSHVMQKASLHHHRKLPVIIYVRSPKIIHTQPSEFMALVQRLTGLMHQNEQNITVSAVGYKKKESCSNVADGNGDVREAYSSSVPLTTRSRNRTLLEDFPLYTPNYSSDHVFRFSDMVFQSPNKSNILVPSPSFMEKVMKDLPYY